jgi:TolB protein
LIVFALLAAGFILSYGGTGRAQSSGAKIAFTANKGGNWELFIMDEDASNVVRLTETLYDEGYPSWSPDRKKIVYSTSDGELNIINVETKESSQISVPGKEGRKSSPALSPDGKRIIFVHFKPGGIDDTELCIYDSEVNSTGTLIDQCGGQLFPRWSPNGNQVVYSHVHCSSGCDQVIQELWIADSRGGNARQLLMTNSLCMQPAWSPDGTKIAFSSDKAGNFDIWVYSLADSKLIQITTDPSLDSNPTWSPDGRKIAFISTRSGKMGIWVKDMKTGKEELLDPFPGKDIECKDIAW